MRGKKDTEEETEKRAENNSSESGGVQVKVENKGTEHLVD